MTIANIATVSSSAPGVWRDRSTHWSIAIGPLQIERSTSQVRYIGTLDRDEAPPSRMRVALTCGAVLLILISCLSWGFTAQASAQKQRFVTPIIDVPMPAVTQSATFHPMSSKAPPARQKPQADAPAMAGNSPAIEDAHNFDRFPAVLHAIDTAFATGEAQDWSEGLFQGLVVAGPAYARGTETCRDTSLLLRDGGFEGMTKSTVICRKADQVAAPKIGDQVKPLS